MGHLEPTKLRTFLTEFFHPDRRTDVNQAAFYHVRWVDCGRWLWCMYVGRRAEVLI